MDLDTKPDIHPDQQPKPVRRKHVKALAVIAIIIAVLAVAMFVGFNAFYAVEAS
ncbi:hypothetical protein [Caulobacter endophyticus]|uniref:hypothetical protein n=1 Tax=Caulobacter endophyticus TaxID=2172652 RepID=UPI0024102DC0|nr:hypothetical protein [Caulobacter endophyticus]MDG2530813.1 hypothetical protein [Caulobacter endophyticus]